MNLLYRLRSLSPTAQQPSSPAAQQPSSPTAQLARRRNPKVQTRIVEQRHWVVAVLRILLSYIVGVGRGLRHARPHTIGIAFLLGVLVMLGGTTTHAQFFCDMRVFDVDCIPLDFSQSYYVEIKTMPPCSVWVTIYGRECDGTIEFLDLSVYYDNVQPPGCASRAEVHAAFSQWSMFTNAVYKEYFKLFAPLDGPIPDCPLAKTYTAATAVACRKPVIVWQVPIVNPPYWTSVTVSYDLSKPWSWYESTKPLGATNPIIQLDRCGENCCYQLVTVCMQGGQVVVTPSGFGPIVDPCPVNPADPNCRVFWCEP